MNQRDKYKDALGCAGLGLLIVILALSFITVFVVGFFAIAKPTI